MEDAVRVIKAHQDLGVGAAGRLANWEGEWMEFVSLLHWLAVVGLFYVIFGIPFARIVRRVGLSRWWSVLTIIPMINLIGLWTLAYMRWPTIDDARITRAA